MGEVRIDDLEGAILLEGDDRGLIGAVGRSEGARTGKDGQAEAVAETDDRLAHVAFRSGLYPTEH
ncbi:MAG: hypothetical protein IKR86_00165 [Candidatus Methanomethylophilaceae archaeon]|nr:hypothetical protein [Candidatus Methanomethylophilaceae archaeon]